MTAQTNTAATQPPMRPDAPRAEILAAVETLFSGSNAIQLATLGGPHTPWILGAYFASTVDDQVTISVMVEKHGKSMQNLVADQRVAFTVNSGDAMQDFAQGSGVATVHSGVEAPEMMALLTAKMPWYQLYTPCAPVTIAVDKLFLTSFSRGWMPAQKLSWSSR